MSEFLASQVKHEDIPYFSYKMRKGQFLSQDVKDKKKEGTAKLFNKQASPPTKHPLVFLRWEIFPLGLAKEFTD